MTVAHSRTRDLAAEVARADILVAAAGAPGLQGRDAVKPGAIVVDVGTTWVDGALCTEIGSAVGCRIAVTEIGILGPGSGLLRAYRRS